MNSASLRIRRCNEAPARPDGDYVLYWMIAARRPSWNFALQRAARWAEDLDRPLIVLEPLRCGYRWASDRIHRFVLDGMADNAAAFEGGPLLYFPYVEPEHGAGRGLLETLAASACAVVTDDAHGFFLPRMVKAAAARLPVALEAVDGVGLLPVNAAARDFPTAYAFRRFLQRELPHHLSATPAPDPLADRALPTAEPLPAAIADRWPVADLARLTRDDTALASLPIDHDVAPVSLRGGARAAAETLIDFGRHRLERYTERNQPEVPATSGLSPYLHFGHVSPHEVFDLVARREDWSIDRLTVGGKGARQGWWQMSPESEAFLDQLVTWRELGVNACRFLPNHDQYESLPAWARRTLEEHADDPREHVYDLDDLAHGRTHDELWNAAQNELRLDGRMHNYLRMLWGKRILEWTPGPREALDVMIELNNKYALDGRDPNSDSGIFWCLGRYDRAWGPERPIFGKVRYMSSANTRRKLRVEPYVQRWARGESSAPTG